MDREDGASGWDVIGKRARKLYPKEGVHRFLLFMNQPKYMTMRLRPLDDARAGNPLPSF